MHTPVRVTLGTHAPLGCCCYCCYFCYLYAHAKNTHMLPIISAMYVCILICVVYIRICYTLYSFINMLANCCQVPRRHRKPPAAASRHQKLANINAPALLMLLPLLLVLLLLSRSSPFAVAANTKIHPSSTSTSSLAFAARCQLTVCGNGVASLYVFSCWSNMLAFQRQQQQQSASQQKRDMHKMFAYMCKICIYILDVACVGRLT